MTEADVAALRAAARDGPRIGFVETSAGPVVVKRLQPPRKAWRDAGLALLARGSGAAMLRPLPADGGSRGQEIEIERLRGLRAAGVRVPAVLHVERGFFAMEKLEGPSLAQLIERGGPAAFEAWRRGLATLTEAHAHGAALSCATARNFIATDAGLGLVGCAADPLEAMPLEAAQARDWLAYLHSTLWRLGRPRAETQAAIAVRLADEAPPVRALVERAAGRFSAWRHLPTSGRQLGAAIAGASALGAVFPLPPVAFQTIDGIL